jgi:hypothetical protein
MPFANLNPDFETLYEPTRIWLFGKPFPTIAYVRSTMSGAGNVPGAGVGAASANEFAPYDPSVPPVTANDSGMPPRRIERLQFRLPGLDAGNDGVDFVLCEIGGTVGDIEGLPFFEAIRQLGNELPRGSTAFIHLTLVPFIPSAGELKTKPTQHSVNELRRIGIHPDVIVCRSREDLSSDIREKIALFADVDAGAVIGARLFRCLSPGPRHLEPHQHKIGCGLQ